MGTLLLKMAKRTTAARNIELGRILNIRAPKRKAMPIRSTERWAPGWIVHGRRVFKLFSKMLDLPRPKTAG
jgi:hypothetical protein